jgi:5-methylcytosine-specific restriction enzyme A
MPAFKAAAETLPWREWYGLLRWKKRSRHQLRVEPLCDDCLKRGRVVPAKVAHHVEPHRGNWNSFRLGKLQSLCKTCHDRKWADDLHGYSPQVGDDGLPTDPRHPFNRLPGTS